MMGLIILIFSLIALVFILFITWDSSVPKAIQDKQKLTEYKTKEEILKEFEFISYRPGHRFSNSYEHSNLIVRNKETKEIIGFIKNLEEEYWRKIED